MIKLIASDMDGTLLNEKKELPKDFFNILDKLEENDITFVAASGRPYITLYENFSPYGDKLSYIGDNGALVVHKGKTIYMNTMDKDIIKKVVDKCSSIPNTAPILCGVKGGYIPPCGEEYMAEMKKYYLKTFIFNSVDEIDDEIFKIAVCDLNDALTNSHPILNEEFGQDLKVVVSGNVWVDIMNQGVHKGAALNRLQEKLNITKNQTMAFGDYYNDVELLGQAYQSYVMENALDDMKQYGNFIAKSNDDEGVTQQIKEYLNTL
ncbi:MAG: Cof-type HAD-IIB family hydrolase [Clostridium sp.]